jgi:phosphoribosylformylglycinamidine synthase
MMVDVIIDIFPKKEVLNPETEAVKKTLSNLGYKNIDELILSKQIKLSFKNLNEEDSLYQSKLMCDQILVNTNIQDYEISLLKKD